MATIKSNFLAKISDSLKLNQTFNVAYPVRPHQELAAKKIRPVNKFSLLLKQTLDLKAEA